MKNIEIIIIQCLNCRYFEICPHGCIICAKKMFLAESTRDPIDIKKSKEYNSPSNVLGLHLLSCKIDMHCLYILDTPCTAASNLATRDPDLHKLWFGDRKGCAEPPTLKKSPSIISIPKLKVIKCFNDMNK